MWPPVGPRVLRAGGGAYGDPDADYGRWSDAAVAPGMPGTRGRYLVIAHKR